MVIQGMNRHLLAGIMAAAMIFVGVLVSMTAMEAKAAEEKGGDIVGVDPSYEIIDDEGENLPEEEADYGTDKGELVVQVGEGGTCTINGETANPSAEYDAGTKLSIYITVESGYELGNITIQDAEGMMYLMEQNASDTYETEYTVYGGVTQTLNIEVEKKEPDAYADADTTVIDKETNAPLYMVFKAKEDASLTVINNGRTYVNQSGQIAYCVNVNKHGAKQGITGKLSKNHSLQHAYDYLMYYGYPAHTTIEGKAFSKRQAHDITQWAAWAIQSPSLESALPGLKSQSAAVRNAVGKLAKNALAYKGGNKKIDGNAFIYVPSSSKKQSFVIPRYSEPLGEIKLKKISSCTAVTEDNAMYSLGGASYGIFADRECTQKRETLTTDQAGNSNTVTLEPATWYVKEERASKGYELDKNIYEVKVNSNQIVTFTVQERPQMDLLGIRLIKRDLETGEDGILLGTADLEDAEFTVRYYDTFDSIDGLKAKRTWVFATKKEDGAYVAKYHKDYQVSGEDLYVYENTYVLPLGTYEIWESKAPKGYTLNKDTVLKDSAGTIVAEGGAHYVTQVKESGGTIMLLGGNTSYCYDRVIRGDLKLQKSIDGGRRLANVRFSIASVSTGESHEFTTDENGMYDSSSAFNRHTNNTNGGGAKDGLWFGQYTGRDGVVRIVDANDDYGAIVYDDDYVIDELPCEANQGLGLITGVHFNLSRDGYEVNLGTFDDPKPEPEPESEPEKVEEPGEVTEEIEEVPKKPVKKPTKRKSVLKSVQTGLHTRAGIFVVAAVLCMGAAWLAARHRRK